MITAPIPTPTSDQEKATFQKRCDGRNEIVSLFGLCIESSVYFYIMLRRFITITPDTMPTLLIDLAPCQDFQPVSPNFSLISLA